MSELANAYRTIVADPPWQQPTGGLHNGSDGRNVIRRPSALPYDTMTTTQIAALPIDALAARDAHLYLWVTNAYVTSAYDLAHRWGFRPSVLLTWCKTPRGIGLGGTFTQTTEHVLFCRRGTLPTGERINTTWFHWPRGRHSEKPGAFLDLVERLSPAPRLEMFARRQRLGWDTWGNEALEHVELIATAGGA